MSKIKRLSGHEVVSIYKVFGFAVIAQVGSHAKMRRITADGQKQTLVVPLHKELDTGTCRALLRQASRFMPIEELKPFFYSE